MGDISEAKMKESFNKFDTDKSGYVDPAEIKAVIKDMDPTIDARVLDGVVKMIMKDVDANKDNKLSFEEFKAGYRDYFAD